MPSGSVVLAGDPSVMYVVVAPSSEVSTRPSSSKVWVAVVDPVFWAISRPESSIVLVLVVVVVIGRIPPTRVVRVVATTSPPRSTV